MGSWLISEDTHIHTHTHLHTPSMRNIRKISAAAAAAATTTCMYMTKVGLHLFYGTSIISA